MNVLAAAAVDQTGRAFRSGKRGLIDTSLAPILDRLAGMDQASWLDNMRHLTRRYCRAIGSTVALRAYRDHLGQVRLNGITG